MAVCSRRLGFRQSREKPNRRRKTMSLAPTLEFWFDFASTYSYPAAMRVESAANSRGCAVNWRPFLLGPIFKAQGWADSPFNIYPSKGRYMWRDLERLCAGLQIPFRKPSVFPRRGLLATRVACALDGRDELPEFARRVFAANFAEDRDIAKADVLLDGLAGLLPDAAAILAAAHDPDAKARVRRNTEQAIALGIFGAPTFVVGEELFWGNDRLDAALEWCRRSESGRTRMA
jgi:2-hydroxychromene-2-carboxylate isomerase